MRWMDSDDLPLFSRGVSGENAPKAAPNTVVGGPVVDSAGRAVMTVSELNRKVRGLLEAKFELQWVSGELSNVLRAAR